MPKKVGGLSLTTLEDAMRALMKKVGHSNTSSWLAEFAGVVEVPYPRNCNLHVKGISYIDLLQIYATFGFVITTRVPKLESSSTKPTYGHFTPMSGENRYLV